MTLYDVAIKLFILEIMQYVRKGKKDRNQYFLVVNIYT